MDNNVALFIISLKYHLQEERKLYWKKSTCKTSVVTLVAKKPVKNQTMVIMWSLWCSLAKIKDWLRRCSTTVHFGKTISNCNTSSSSSSLNGFYHRRCPTNLEIIHKFILHNFLPVIIYIMHAVVKLILLVTSWDMQQWWSLSIEGGPSEE